MTNIINIEEDPLDELLVRNPRKELKTKPCRVCHEPMEYVSENKTTCFGCTQKRKKRWYAKNKTKLHVDYMGYKKLSKKNGPV